jgi:hypothetical protein
VETVSKAEEVLRDTPFCEKHILQLGAVIQPRETTSILVHFNDDHTLSEDQVPAYPFN